MLSTLYVVKKVRKKTQSTNHNDMMPLEFIFVDEVF